jgi:hypothetical protein
MKQYAKKAYGGSGYIEPRYLNLGTSWRCVLSFKPLPFYTRGESPRYSLERRLEKHRIRVSENQVVTAEPEATS